MYVYYTKAGKLHGKSDCGLMFGEQGQPPQRVYSELKAPDKMTCNFCGEQARQMSFWDKLKALVNV